MYGRFDRFKAFDAKRKTRSFWLRRRWPRAIAGYRRFSPSSPDPRLQPDASHRPLDVRKDAGGTPALPVTDGHAPRNTEHGTRNTDGAKGDPITTPATSSVGFMSNRTGRKDAGGTPAPPALPVNNSYSLRSQGGRSRLRRHRRRGTADQDRCRFRTRSREYTRCHWCR